MVVLPYKDRLLLFSRYLQQLVMESLGKRFDLQGRARQSGHRAFTAIRDRRINMPTFSNCARALTTSSRSSSACWNQVVPLTRWSRALRPATILHGFLLGTRAALFENDRESMTITVPRVDARTVGGLIALFERAVGLYASLIGINAYHQPGVEAGKKAAASILALQGKVLSVLSETPQTAEEIASAAGAPDATETVCLLLEHLAANGRAHSDGIGSPGQMTFCKTLTPQEVIA